MAKAPKTDALETADYRHDGEKRANIPPARLAAQGRVPRVAKARYRYNPHLPPVLRFDPTGKADEALDLQALIDKAGKAPLTAEEQGRLREALAVHQPWLEWTQKQEQHDRGFFQVDPVVLHIHERLSARAIVRAALREDVQRKLFADPQQEYKDAVKFYQHDVDWANRLILGDALQVMSSLAQRERLAGEVQMIYIDPPYGIRFGSNFQPEVGKRDVKDKETDLTREPEMVRAYRDTWKLGYHSYLAYLRDRLQVARDLLADSGSIFVQIGDENLHRVRCLMDEVFGADNFHSQITFRTSVPLKSVGLAGITDYVLWYARNRKAIRRYDLFSERTLGTGGIYTNFEESSGHRRTMTAEEREGESPQERDSRVFGTDNLVSSGYTDTCIFDVVHEGTSYSPTSGKSWKTNQEGMRRLLRSHRVNASGKTLRAMMYLEDYPVQKLTNLWTDVKGENDKLYVVQTPTKVIQRCMLMATKPGDLVLDPTCGSGTTAYVAEQWGRRWISIDTSRVALSLARQRLLTSRFDHYKTEGDAPCSGFRLKTVPHVTLGSIAQNTNLDPIFARHEPILDAALDGCNAALVRVPVTTRKALADKLVTKVAKDGKRAVTDADQRRWSLPKDRFEHWTVPFDTDPDWPKALQDAVTAYRAAWRAKMDEVNACIDANAEQEELVDQPEVVKGVVRVSGPFTVEGVRPEELSLGEEGLFDGTPNEVEDTLPHPTLVYGATNEPLDTPPEVANLHAYLAQMTEHLRRDGVTFPGNKHRKLIRIEPLLDSGSLLHAEGAWEGTEDDDNQVGIAFGPQYGPVTAQVVEELIGASRRYTDLIVAGFSFEADACALIKEQSHPRLRIHQAHIRPDVNPGMDGLLKDTPNSQLFTVFGTPEIQVERDGESWVCELVGVDIYDPVTNVVRSTKAEKVAAWFLDSDFDGRCFCVTQAFFPDQDAWEKIAKALKGSADPDAFDAFKGTRSVPFKAGTHRRIAVKVVDPRGNEVMAIRGLGR